MKYAVVESGGKQYIAREGEMIEIDRIPLEVGKPVEFNEVLLIVNDKTIQVGNPLIKGATVKGEVLDQFKAKKVIVFKYIPKERYRRKQGHRQRYTRVRINEIATGSSKKTEAKVEAESEAESQSAKPAAKAATSNVTTPKTVKTETKPKAAPKTTAKPAAKSGSASKPKTDTKSASKPKSSSTSKSSAGKSSSTASKKPSSKKTSSKKDE